MPSTSDWAFSFSRASLPMCACATTFDSKSMTSEAFIGLIVAAGLIAYLVTALVHPEKF
jgi:K+-transporting ATPase KdpF subunit